MLKYLGFICVIAGFALADDKGRTLGKMREEYGKVVKGCITEFPLTDEDSKALDSKKTTANINCTFDCILKKTGMMDGDGNLSIEGVRKSTELVFPGDPVMKKEGEKFIESCKDVNDVAVTDGNKGCERAGLILLCCLEKASNFGLF